MLQCMPRSQPCFIQTEQALMMTKSPTIVSGGQGLGSNWPEIGKPRELAYQEEYWGWRISELLPSLIYRSNINGDGEDVKLQWTTGPGNLPAVQIWTRKTVQFSSKPSQNPTHFVLVWLFPGTDLKSGILDWVEPGLQFHYTVPATFTPIQDLNSDCIITWSIRWLCSYYHSFASHIHICDRTHIHWIIVKSHHIVCNIRGFSMATQWIFVWSQIWQREVKERQKLHNVLIDHVMIWSELRYIIGAKIVNSKCQVLCGNASPFQMVWVLRLVIPVATVWFRRNWNQNWPRKLDPLLTLYWAASGSHLWCSRDHKGLIQWLGGCTAVLCLMLTMTFTWSELQTRGLVVRSRTFWMWRYGRKCHFGRSFLLSSLLQYCCGFQPSLNSICMGFHHCLI